MKKYYFILSFCLICSIGAHAQVICDGTNVLQETDITSDVLIAGFSTLTATNQITGSAEVTYQAEDYVLLKGGFFVNGNSSLLAKTEGCTVSTKDLNIAGFQMTVLNNPTASIASVEYTLENGIELEITLLDLLGQKVKTIQSMQQVYSGSHSEDIDLTSFPQGNYFLHFRTSEGKMNVSKLVKI